MEEILSVATAAQLQAVRALFLEYAASLSIDLCFQHFEQELASLPGEYAAPRGALFLCQVEGTPAGCIGLRPFSETVGELKRLYVMPRFRGRKLGRALVWVAMEAARRIGYAELVLDTLATMHPAVALYHSCGFQPAEPYYANPLPDVLYFRAELKTGRV